MGAEVVSSLPGVRHRRVHVGELELYLAEAGDPGAPPAVLLHGFPEFWWTWHRQLPALAAAGLHVLAPDLRGYHLSDKPRDVDAYGLDHLAADVVGLVRTLPGGRAAVVGHDWGGVVAWRLAERHPELVTRVAVLNAPHPASLWREITRPSDQALRSSYMLPFQLPWVPERVLGARNHVLLRIVLRGLHSRPVEDGELDPYVEAARIGGLTGPLNYYRAFGRSLLRRWPEPERRTPVDAPALVIWGMDDRALGPALASPPPWFTDVRVERVYGASHDVHHDAADKVNELLVRFLTP